MINIQNLGLESSYDLLSTKVSQYAIQVEETHPSVDNLLLFLFSNRHTKDTQIAYYKDIWETMNICVAAGLATPLSVISCLTGCMFVNVSPLSRCLLGMTGILSGYSLGIGLTGIISFCLKNDQAPENIVQKEFADEFSCQHLVLIDNPTNNQQFLATYQYNEFNQFKVNIYAADNITSDNPDDWEVNYSILI